MEVDWEGTSASSRGPRAGVRDWKLWVDKIEDTTTPNDRDHPPLSDVHCVASATPPMGTAWVLDAGSVSVLQRPAVNGGLDGHPRAARPTPGGFPGDFSRSFWDFSHGLIHRKAHRWHKGCDVMLCGLCSAHSLNCHKFQVKRVAAME